MEGGSYRHSLYAGSVQRGLPDVAWAGSRLGALVGARCAGDRGAGVLVVSFPRRRCLGLLGRRGVLIAGLMLLIAADSALALLPGQGGLAVDTVWGLLKVSAAQ